MPLTRTFRTIIMERAARDARFRECLLTEAIDQLLGGDLAVGKAMFRDYIGITDRVATRQGRSSTKGGS